MNAREPTRGAQSAARSRSLPHGSGADELGYVSRHRGARPDRGQRQAETSVRSRTASRDAQAGQRRSDSRPAYVYNEGVGHASRSARPAPAHSTPRTQARRKRTPAPHGAEHVRRRARRSTHSRRVWREIGSWVVTLALAALVGFVVRGFVFELVRVEGPSMSPTLASGEVLLVTRFDYLTAEPARGDVVVCRYPNRDGTFIKRVIALPGDEFEIRDGCTYVNGAQIAESYVEFAATEDYGPVLIGDGQYMLLGDNRAISHDSRASDVGTLRADDMVGRVRWVVYPFDAVREVAN